MHFWEYINGNQTFILDSHWPFICSVHHARVRTAADDGPLHLPGHLRCCVLEGWITSPHGGSGPPYAAPIKSSQHHCSPSKRKGIVTTFFMTLFARNKYTREMVQTDFFATILIRRTEGKLNNYRIFTNI